MADSVVVVIDDGLSRYTRGRCALKSGASDEFRVVEIVIAHPHLRLEKTGVADVRSSQRAESRGSPIPFLIHNDVLNEVGLIEVFELQFGDGSP